MLHHRLRTVVAGADGDALVVEYRADVVRMNPLNDEGEYARLLARRPDDADALDGRKPLGRVTQKLLLVRVRRLAVNAVQIINRGAEPDREAMAGVPASNLSGMAA